MSSWRPDFQPDHLYFVTTKAVDYAHIFQRECPKRLILDTLDFFRTSRKMKLFAFVIMPNHIHLIAQFPDADPIPAVIRDFKKHTADRLIRQLKAERDQAALDLLAAKVTRSSKQTYKIWEDGYNAKDIFSMVFLQQKMDYIHYNPCQPQWKLCNDPIDYLWSSARFYLTEDPCIIPIDDARDL
jgi:REP element-mobilizing transposase RayT